MMHDKSGIFHQSDQRGCLVFCGNHCRCAVGRDNVHQRGRRRTELSREHQSAEILFLRDRTPLAFAKWRPCGKSRTPFRADRCAHHSSYDNQYMLVVPCEIFRHLRGSHCTVLSHALLSAGNQWSND